MSIIESISGASAKWLAKHVPNTEYLSVEDQVSVYQYGFQVIYGAINKFLLLILVSYLFNAIIPTLLIALTFSSFRIIAGGFHLKTYLKCMVWSILMFVATALVAKHTYYYGNNINIYFLMGFLIGTTIISGLYIIYKYVPRDTPNKPINKQEEIIKYKRWCLYYLIIWSILMGVLLVSNMHFVAICSCFGLLLELFSISELGIKYVYMKIDNYF